MLTDEFELLIEYRQSIEIETDKWADFFTVGFILTMERIGAITSPGGRQ